MAENNILAEKSIEFAIRIVKCYKYLSPADFVSKMSIALKEATETSYWLIILSRTDYLEKTACDSLKSELDEIIRILISSIKTTKKNWT